MKLHAAVLVHTANEAVYFGPHNAFQRLSVRGDHVHFQPSRTQRRRHLQTDEACAHHNNLLGLFRPGDDRFAVGKAPQIVHLRRLRSRNFKAEAQVAILD